MLPAMRLMNPGAITDALNTLRYIDSQRVNSVATHDAAVKKRRFLSWCDEAEGQFRNHFSSSPLFDELQATYYRVAGTALADIAVLNGTLNRETANWERRIEDVSKALRELLEFGARPGRAVAVDTSALMQGEFFTGFDWRTLDDSLKAGAIRLIIPALVIEELDDLKRHHQKTQKSRARRVLKSLWELHRPQPTKPAVLPDQPDVTVEVFLDNGWHLRQPNNDAEIIDQALQVHEAIGRPVILASCDHTQLYRSAAVGLQAVLMPRLDDDADGGV
ncbi:MAG: hypothetical protein JWL97_3843 [Gemmatimonadales bacterium]|jgi:hypothetical protein|nr:hypothetical protein [Gemmatimonadales bacterium]